MADIIGARIKAVRPWTDAELDRESWLGQVHPRQCSG